MKQFYVYVAGPLSSDMAMGTHNAVKAAATIFDRGHFPFVPHILILWQLVSPQTYEEAMRMCFAWLRKCDALVRLPGHSSGSDREVQLATEIGIPVFFGMEELMKSPMWATAE